MKQKILIIEDNQNDRELIKAYIRKAGYEYTIIEAQDCSEALNIIQKDTDFDCLFLDYMLPDMDGIRFLKKIYDCDKELAPFPVVMLTGQGSEAVAADAIRYGAQDYLTKSGISTDTLHVAILKAQKFFKLQQNHNTLKNQLRSNQEVKKVI